MTEQLTNGEGKKGMAPSNPTDIPSTQLTPLPSGGVTNALWACAVGRSGSLFPNAGLIQLTPVLGPPVGFALMAGLLR